jgi:hypothetical protein
MPAADDSGTKTPTNGELLYAKRLSDGGACSPSIPRRESNDRSPKNTGTTGPSGRPTERGSSTTASPGREVRHLGRERRRIGGKEANRRRERPRVGPGRDQDRLRQARHRSRWSRSETAPQERRCTCT